MFNELDIVNAMLAVNSLRAVSTLETLHPDVAQARTSLRGSNLDFQAIGWWFNKEFDLKLVVDNNGHIILPQDTIDVQISASVLARSSPDLKRRYVRRGGKMYDAIAHTFEIDQSLYVDLTVNVDYEDLPAIAAVYLKKYAVYRYFADDDGDQIKAKTLIEDRDRAWGFLQAKQLQVLGVNALDSPAAAELNYRIRQQGMATNPNFPGGRT